MSYQLALEAAGAKVHEFGEFGSYQGDWWAKVTFENKTGWVCGSYGSCSGCDAFQAEFGYDHHTCGNDEYYDPIYNGTFRDGCEMCMTLKSRLIRFGSGYLDNIMSQADAETEASKNLYWDMDARKMVDFIVSHRDGDSSS